MRTDRIRILEISAVITTAVGKFIFMDVLNQRLPFIICVTILWTAYIVYQSRRSRTILHHWGFRDDNFNHTLKIVLPFAGVAVFLFVLVGAWQNTLNLTWHIIPVMILYPVWGVLQQFMVIVLVGGNLQDMESVSLPLWSIILMTAIFFGMVHLPFYWLVAGTFVLALFYGYVYMRSRNVWVMGILHGWLGALFYYTVVDRDPFLEVFKFITPDR